MSGSPSKYIWVISRCEAGSEYGEMDVGWPPAVDVIAKGISARFDGSKKEIAVFVSQHSPAAAEIRVDRRDIGVVALAIASTRIRLPHLDERVGHRATVAIENGD